MMYEHVLYDGYWTVSVIEGSPDVVVRLARADGSQQVDLRLYDLEDVQRVGLVLDDRAAELMRGKAGGDES